MQRQSIRVDVGNMSTWVLYEHMSVFLLLIYVQLLMLRFYVDTDVPILRVVEYVCCKHIIQRLQLFSLKM